MEQKKERDAVEGGGDGERSRGQGNQEGGEKTFKDDLNLLYGQDSRPSTG